MLRSDLIVLPHNVIDARAAYSVSSQSILCGLVRAQLVLWAAKGVANTEIAQRLYGPSRPRASGGNAWSSIV
jgi:hypothetical protein